MPRIDAPTVAEHHSRKRATLLAAGAELLAEQGVDGVTLGAVGAAAGLARSSVYQYFDSAPALLAAVVNDLAASAAEHLARTRDAAPTPTARIEEFVRSALDTSMEATHRSLAALDPASLPAECRAHVAALHQRQFEPLRQDLAELGDERPELTAQLIGGVLSAAYRALADGAPKDTVVAHTLAFIGHGVGTAAPD
ncbi:TetR/AcrR family transcriptional regulator [Tessaracoccus sp. G1721]